MKNKLFFYFSTVYPELAAAYGATVPDFRGLFLRGYGGQSHAQNNGTTIGVTATLHQSGALGVVQGDAIREIYGYIGDAFFDTAWSSGAFSTWVTSSFLGGSHWYTRLSGDLRASRVAPTAPEIRPANMAVRHLVRALN